MDMELKTLRSEIDSVDRQLIELLEKRMDIAARIAAWKAAAGIPTLDTGREAEKLEAVRALCRPETADLIADVFQDVMAASRTYQTSLRRDEHAG